MYTTAKKRGKFGKNPGKEEGGGAKGTAHKLPTMYSAVEFGGGKPDSSRRFTNNYGKTSRSLLRGWMWCTTLLYKVPSWGLMIIIPLMSYVAVLKDSLFSNMRWKKRLM